MHEYQGASQENPSKKLFFIYFSSIYILYFDFE